MELLNETAWHGDQDGATLLLDETKGMFNAIGGTKGLTLYTLTHYTLAHCTLTRYTLTHCALTTAWLMC